MKKKNEVSAELLNEYLRIRMEQYAEKKIKRNESRNRNRVL